MKPLAHARALMPALCLILCVSASSAGDVGWPLPTEQVRATRSLERIERRLSVDDEADLDPSMQRDLLRAVLAMAELERVTELHEPRITLLLAELSLAAGSGSAERASRLFKSASSEGHDASVHARAFLGLGRALTRLRDERGALDAFSSALGLSWAEERRALIYLERGLANLRFLRLDAALADLRRALLVSRVDTLRFEASMLLAIAYERRLDLPSALAVIERALFGGRPKRPARTPFGSPWHSDLTQPEASYGEALVAMGVAQARSTPLDKKRRAFEAAVRHWERYLELTSSAREPFAANAERHASACRNALEQLGPEPPEPAAD